MTLKELLSAVKDDKLPRELIERYRDDLVHVFTQVCLEKAELKKREAFYFVDPSRKELSDVAIKRTWRATADGQRLLELEAYKSALPKEIESLKSRIFALL